MMRFLSSTREDLGGFRQTHGGARGGFRNNSRRGARGGSHHFSSSSRQARPSSSPSFRSPLSILAENPTHRNSPVKDGVSFAEVVRSSPPHSQAQTLSSTVKLRRSLGSGEICKHYLQPGHSVGECRHQLTCQRCSGVGHFAVRCPLRTPHHDHPTPEKTLRNPKKHALAKDNPLKSLLHVPARSSFLRVSLPISEAIIQSKDDLKRMIIIKVLSGNASVKLLHDFLPQALKSDQCEHITPFGDDFILTLFSARIAVAIVKRSPVHLHSNLGQCSLKLSHWTPKFGSHSIAAGNYNWIRMSNLPLHCWNWNSILEVF